MVVVTPGVTGDARAVCPRVSLPVTETEHDDAARTRQHLLRIGAAFLVPLQPCHLTGMARLQPLLKLVRVLGRGAAGDPADGEAEALGQRDEFFFHDRRFHENAPRACSTMAPAIAGGPSTDVSITNCAASR